MEFATITIFNFNFIIVVAEFTVIITVIVTTTKWFFKDFLFNL